MEWPFGLTRSGATLAGRSWVLRGERQLVHSWFRLRPAAKAVRGQKRGALLICGVALWIDQMATLAGKRRGAHDRGEFRRGGRHPCLGG